MAADAAATAAATRATNLPTATADHTLTKIASGTCIRAGGFFLLLPEDAAARRIYTGALNLASAKLATKVSVRLTD